MRSRRRHDSAAQPATLPAPPPPTARTWCSRLGNSAGLPRPSRATPFRPGDSIRACLWLRVHRASVDAAGFRLYLPYVDFRPRAAPGLRTLHANAAAVSVGGHLIARVIA